jgi:hypothetical protein
MSRPRQRPLSRKWFELQGSWAAPDYDVALLLAHQFPSWIIRCQPWSPPASTFFFIVVMTLVGSLVSLTSSSTGSPFQPWATIPWSPPGPRDKILYSIQTLHHRATSLLPPVVPTTCPMSPFLAFHLTTILLFLLMTIHSSVICRNLAATVTEVAITTPAKTVASPYVRTCMPSHPNTCSPKSR